MSVTRDVALWFDQPSHQFEQDRLFDRTRTWPNFNDGVFEPFQHVWSVLAEQGVSVHTADLIDRYGSDRSINLYVSTAITKRFRQLARRPDVIMSAFIAIESPIVGRRMYARLHEASRVFRRMYACNNGGSALRPFLKGPVTFEPIFYPYSFESVDERAWARRDRSFLAMINMNKTVPGEQELYTERLRAIDFFAREDEIDLYGMGWDGPPYPVSPGRWMPSRVRRLAWHAERALSHLHPDPLLRKARSVWRGRVSSKLETLSQYRFSIVIENMMLDGWITEKLFDCMRAGCVPVYLGAPDVDRWVPPACFIDMRRFASYPELRTYLHSLGNTELENYREAARDFLASARFRPFTKHAFADVFTRILEEDAGVTPAAMTS